MKSGRNRRGACLVLAFIACNSPGALPADAEPEAVLERGAPKEPIAQRALAKEARATRRYDVCAALYLLAFQGDALSRHDRLHAAECLALAGKPNRALATLERMAAEGFAELERLDNPDFASLRSSWRWPRLHQRTDANRRRLSQRNPELARLYVDDQADRKQRPEDLAAFLKRDEARRRRVGQIMVKEGLKSAEDHFCAAMILQHGAAVEDYRLAHSLALMAAKLAPQRREARWLAAASKDRELRALGKPQLFGTQFTSSAGGAMERAPTSPLVTDEERLRWGVPPLVGNEPSSWALGTEEAPTEEW
jgi:hypothetical protein